MVVLVLYALMLFAFPLPSLGQSSTAIPDEECQQSFDCGEFKIDYFPFWGGPRPLDCGVLGFKLHCENDEHVVITISGIKHRVLNITREDYTMVVARSDLYGNVCPSTKLDSPAMLDGSYYAYTASVSNLTLAYDCSDLAATEPGTFSCPGSDDRDNRYFIDTALNPVLLGRCPGGTLRVPVNHSEFMQQIERQSVDVVELLKKGYEVNYTATALCSACRAKGGVCNDNGPLPCTIHKDKTKEKIIIGVCSGFGGIFIICAAYFLYQIHKKKRYSMIFSRNISSVVSSGKDIEKAGSTYLGFRVFTYEELVECTDNFDSSKELGDGGFGTVYKGKLKDGRTVAVKRLYENNYKRVEQFMNEIDILARIRHPNLVSLYGCTTHDCRELLLVYEFIPNGTVADHLHKTGSKPEVLSWPTRLNIAVETACALTYLHRTEIIHRDVKTNNILLDKNFTVKVADFGLSRLFPIHVTHVSTAPQGTPGYVDPDYHQCYQLTSKSDVFSFGVVLMELVTSMPAVDITRHRHDINLSTMAINRIQNHALHEIVDSTLGFESDPEAKKMITAVAELAFQCLQNDKDMRPSMNDVWEELKAIQSRDQGPEKAVKVITSEDDAVLLKNTLLSLSPDSVSISWSSTSRNTTPNASNEILFENNN